MQLKKKIDLWKEAKLITVKQANAIMAYEAEHTRSWGGLSFAWLGVFCIGLGLVSLIASNWDMIADGVKIGGDFILLGAVLGGAYWAFARGYEKIYEIGLLLGFLLCGATIGLVAQIFHLNADPQNGILLWAAAALPIVLCSRFRLLAFVWIPLFVYTQIDYLYLEDIWRFFRAGPLLATAVCTLACGAVAYGASRIEFSFFKAIKSWAVFLMYLSIFAGDAVMADVYASPLPGFVVTMGFLGFIAYLNLRENAPKSFNTNTLFMAARILILYFQVFISLAVTGIGLIVSGCVVLGLVWGWRRIKNHLKTTYLGVK